LGSCSKSDELEPDVNLEKTGPGHWAHSGGSDKIESEELPENIGHWAHKEIDNNELPDDNDDDSGHWAKIDDIPNKKDDNGHWEKSNFKITDDPILSNPDSFEEDSNTGTFHFKSKSEREKEKDRSNLLSELPDLKE